MEGKFIRIKKPNVLLLVCGLFLIALQIFLLFVDPEAGAETFVMSGMGILFILISLFPMIINRKAYLRIENGSVKARYNLRCRLDCRIDEIEFALPQMNALTLLMKNGKRRNILWLENNYELAYAIRKQNRRPETETVDTLREKLLNSKSARKKGIVAVIIGFALTFANIFLAVLLTGGRETEEFIKRDWIVIAVIAVIEILLYAAILYIGLGSKKSLYAASYEYRLLNAYPEPSENRKYTRIYMQIFGNVRKTVYRIPDSDYFFYCEEQLTKDLELETVFTSDIIEDEDFEDLIDSGIFVEEYFE